MLNQGPDAQELSFDFAAVPGLKPCGEQVTRRLLLAAGGSCCGPSSCAPPPAAALVLGPSPPAVLTRPQGCAVRDVWARSDLGSFTGGSFTATVASHDAAFVVVTVTA